MLQQALRRVLPAGLRNVQPASAAGASRVGDAFVQANGKQQGFSSDAQVRNQLPFLSMPLSLDSQRESVQSSPVSSTPMLPTMAGMFGMRPSFAAAPVFGAPRSFSTLRAAQAKAGMLPAVRGLGLGLASKQHQPTSLQQTRSFVSDGQMLGNAFLLTTDLMFWSGLLGGILFRRNLIVLLLCTEIVMLACNMNFLYAAAYLNDMTGVLMSITITTVAACETAIGLALCVTYYHLRSATDVEALNFLK